jgi:acyl-CoA synthetase (AMP-forming)/AMP-acid ligase II
MTDVWPRTHLVELLSERARRHPERVALRFLHDGESDQNALTYAELHARACRLAALLSERTRAGERALLLYPSGPEYVTALLACFYAGVVAVPAYPPQSVQPQQVGRILAIARDAQPALLLTEQAMLGPLTMLRGTLPELSTVEVVATDGAAAAGLAGFTPAPFSSDTLALLQYTSGSTSTPKGVMLSHKNLMANEAAIRDAFSITDDDVIVSWLPLFHDMGLIGTLLQPLYSGVSAVLMAPQRFMERPQRWLDAISRYGGTVSGAPDFAYRLCTQRIDPSSCPELRLDSWRLAFCGAEPVRAQTLHAFVDKFASKGFSERALYPCYGLAEATLIVTGGARGQGVVSTSFSSAALRANQVVPGAGPGSLVSCGVPRAGHRVVIADAETSEPLAPGQVGEITASGPSIARGYWQNPEASASTFVERADGVFLRTGDLGFLHDGNLYVTGRRKDLIIVRGQNLYPQDLERAIEEQNEVVRKGRVVAFGYELAGEECIGIAAEVSPRLQKLIDPPAVCAAISALVAQQFGEPPRAVLLLQPGAVPITSSGKLQRSACCRGFLEQTLALFHAEIAG